MVASEEILTLSKVKAHADAVRGIADDYPLAAAIVFIAAFVVVNLFLPGAALLTLLGGYAFGVLRAVVYVDVATTAAAVLCFVISRNVCGKVVQRRYADRLESLNAHIAEYGYLYLLLIRLFPMLPFFGINLTAGLTRVKLRTFAWTTAAGSIPGIAIFSYAGGSLLAIRSVEEVLTPKAIIAVALLIIMLVGVLAFRLAVGKD